MKTTNSFFLTRLFLLCLSTNITALFCPGDKSKIAQKVTKIITQLLSTDLFFQEILRKNPPLSQEIKATISTYISLQISLKEAQPKTTTHVLSKKQCHTLFTVLQNAVWKIQDKYKEFLDANPVILKNIILFFNSFFYGNLQQHTIPKDLKFEIIAQSTHSRVAPSSATAPTTTPISTSSQKPTASSSACPYATSSPARSSASAATTDQGMLLTAIQKFLDRAKAQKAQRISEQSDAISTLRTQYNTLERALTDASKPADDFDAIAADLNAIEDAEKTLRAAEEELVKLQQTPEEDFLTKRESTALSAIRSKIPSAKA